MGDWARLLPFGVVVGGISFLSLKGLCATPTIGPILQVSHYDVSLFNIQLHFDDSDSYSQAFIVGSFTFF